MKYLICTFICCLMVLPFAQAVHQKKPEVPINRTFIQKDRQTKSKWWQRIFKWKKNKKADAIAKKELRKRSGLLRDNRIYFGLILLGGGIVVQLLFGGLLGFIGTLGIILGLGLIVWALIELE